MVTQNNVNASYTLGANRELANNAQPAFCAYNSSTDADQTGNGTLVTVDFDTEVFDQNADFAADTFTAPVTGRYYFVYQLELDDIAAANTSGNSFIVTSNRTFYHNYYDYGNCQTAAGIYAIQGNAQCDMDAADTSTIQVQINNGGADTVDVNGHATDMLTFYAGYLTV